MTEEGNESEPQQEMVPVRVNPLQLNAVKDEGVEIYKGLMFVRRMINSTPMTTLVDFGATHNFIPVEMGRKLGLHFSLNGSTMKTVNSKVVGSQGLAKGVDLWIDKWMGEIDRTVVPLDDYELVLGHKFLKKAKVMIIPHLKGMLIGDEAYPCFVKALALEEF